MVLVFKQKSGFFMGEFFVVGSCDVIWYLQFFPRLLGPFFNLDASLCG